MSGRIRTLKPEWLDDERLASASDAARLLSAGLVLLADDHGNGRANVAWISRQVWPYAPDSTTLAKAKAALAELVKIDFVRIYVVDGQTYFHIRNWAKHQRVQKPGAPRVPQPPPSSGSGTTLAEANPQASLLDVGAIPEGLRNIPETLPTPPEDPRPDLRSPINDHDHDLEQEPRAGARHTTASNDGSQVPVSADHILTELRNHHVLVDAGYATPNMADVVLGIAIAAAKPLDLVRSGIVDVALELQSAAARGEPWSGEVFDKKLRSYVRQAKARTGAGVGTAEAERATAMFADVWASRHGRAYTPSSSDVAAAGKLVSDARRAIKTERDAGRLEHDLQVTDVLRHWFKRFLAETDQRVRDAEFPLAMLAPRVGTYGLPAKARKSAPAEPRPAEEPAPAPIPSEAAAASAAAILSKITFGDGGNGTLVERPTFTDPRA